MTKSIKMTLGTMETVHGITVRKATFGAYLRNIQLEKQFSDILQNIVLNIQDNDYKGNAAVLADLIDELVDTIAKIIEADKNALRELTLIQILDVWNSYQKLNDLTEFFVLRLENEKGNVDKDRWVQRWIAVGLSIGLSKEAMLNDYYLDELITIVDSYNAMHSGEKEISAEEF